MKARVMPPEQSLNHADTQVQTKQAAQNRSTCKRAHEIFLRFSTTMLSAMKLAVVSASFVESGPRLHLRLATLPFLLAISFAYGNVKEIKQPWQKIVDDKVQKIPADIFRFRRRAHPRGHKKIVFNYNSGRL